MDEVWKLVEGMSHQIPYRRIDVHFMVFSKALAKWIDVQKKFSLRMARTAGKSLHQIDGLIFAELIPWTAEV